MGILLITAFSTLLNLPKNNYKEENNSNNNKPRNKNKNKNKTSFS